MLCHCSQHSKSVIAPQDLVFLTIAVGHLAIAVGHLARVARDGNVGRAGRAAATPRRGLASEGRSGGGAADGSGGAVDGGGGGRAGSHEGGTGMRAGLAVAVGPS